MVALSEPQKHNQSQCINEPFSSATMKDMDTLGFTLKLKLAKYPERSFLQDEHMGRGNLRRKKKQKTPRKDTSKHSRKYSDAKVTLRTK